MQIPSKVLLVVGHNYVTFSSTEEGVALTKKLLNVYYRDQNTRQLCSIYLGRGDKFPTGYLDKFLEKAAKRNLECVVEDVRQFQRLSENFHIRDEDELMPHQKMALETLGDAPTGMISCPTGSGKSKIIHHLVQQKSGVTLVIVPTKIIQDQFASAFVDLFGRSKVGVEVPARPWFVSMEKQEERANSKSNENKISNISLAENPIVNDLAAFGYSISKSSVKKISDSKPRKPFKKNNENKKWHKSITILCYQSLSKLPKWYLELVQVVIVDECHTASIKTIRDALWQMPNASYRYGFSATPWRDQKHELDLLGASLGRNILFEYTPQQAIEDGVVVKPDYHMLNPEAPEEYVGKIRNPHEVVERCIVENKTRNLEIVKLVKRSLEDAKNIFVAVDFIRHVNILKAEFDKAGIPVSVLHGDLTPSEKSKTIESLRGSEDNFVFLGTMAAGIGFDLPEIDVVILATWGKSSIKLIQRIGRGLRTANGKTKLKVYDFFDWFNPITKKHSKERIRVFRKYFGIEPLF